jgi:hypothetical protein
VGGGGGIVRGERLAVAPPGGVELDHDVEVGGEEGGEDGGGEDDDVGLVDLFLRVRLVEEIVAVLLLLVVTGALFLEPLVGLAGGNFAGVVDEVLEVFFFFNLAIAGGEGDSGGGEEEEKDDGERSRRRHGRVGRSKRACCVPTTAGGKQTNKEAHQGPKRSY